MDAQGARPEQLAKLEAKWQEREADKLRRRELAAEVSDPAESAHVFWQSFNEGKRQALDLVDSAEAGAQPGEDVPAHAGGSAEGGAPGEPAALLREATKVVSGLQEQVARATIFLPAYDQRLSSDTVVSLHEAIAKARRRVCPKPAFSFKTRKSAPAPLAALIAQVRQEVGTTSDQFHLQGDTTAEALDPDLCYVDREGETLTKATGQVQGRDFVLARLKNCTVFIADTCGAVRADRLENCRIYIGPTRSLLAEKLDNTTIAVAAQQLRIHSASQCDFFVRMRSGPIIEHSTGARFAPYHFTYPALAAHMHAFNLTSDNGLWCKVEDFNWLRAQQSPNWSVLPEDARPPFVAAPSECAGTGDGECAAPTDGDDNGDEM